MASCFKLCFVALFIFATTSTLLLSTAESVNSTTKSPPASTLHPPQAKKPSGEYRTYIILLWPPTDRDGSAMDAAAHRQWHESFLPTRLTDAGEPRLLRSYRFVFNGFAASLTEAELEAVARKPGFLHSFPDRVRHLLTTHTPAFLGLTKDSGVWRDTSYGKGVVIDRRRRRGHQCRASVSGRPWHGGATSGVEGLVPRCNNKLVGAKTFLPGDDDPRDLDGHGTHTATIAAGNFVDGVSRNGLAPGTAAGIAPGAHLATYRACDEIGCNDTAILHAMDAAIEDGVDVLSISIGKNTAFDNDPIAIGAYTAVSRDVIVVAAAGNDGPAASTVVNEAPWILTVAAGTVDRMFPADVQHEDGHLTLGQSFGERTDSSSHRDWTPLQYVVDDEEERHCQYLEHEVFDNKIVVCEAVASSDRQQEIIQLLLDNGADGVVLIDEEENGYTTILQDFGPRVVQVASPNAEYATSPKPAGIISLVNNTQLDFGPAPVVAHFSSRGPSRRSPGVLKPDIDPRAGPEHPRRSAFSTRPLRRRTCLPVHGMGSQVWRAGPR
ncbi:hypothetical protein EJB05_32504, partial [Eragrostis curvula]